MLLGHLGPVTGLLITNNPVQIHTYQLSSMVKQPQNPLKLKATPKPFSLVAQQWIIPFNLQQSQLRVIWGCMYKHTSHPNSDILTPMQPSPTHFHSMSSVTPQIWIFWVSGTVESSPIKIWFESICIDRSNWQTQHSLGILSGERQIHVFFSYWQTFK